jgi:hypothetical protein
MTAIFLRRALAVSGTESQSALLTTLAGNQAIANLNHDHREMAEANSNGQTDRHSPLNTGHLETSMSVKNLAFVIERSDDYY